MLFNNNEHVIGDEIRAKQDEFGSLMQLGQKMYGRQPGQKTEEKINSLGERDETSSRLLDRQLQWKMVKLLARTGWLMFRV